MPQPQFEDIIDRLPNYLREFRESARIPMETPAKRRSLRNALPASEDVYVFHQDYVSMYVGRSDRLADRLLEHGRPTDPRPVVAIGVVGGICFLDLHSGAVA